MGIIKVLEKIEKTMIVILFSMMVLCVFFQVVNRNIVQASVSWFEEVSRYCMVYMTILGAELGLRDGSQLAIDAFKNSFSPCIKKTCDFLSRLAIIVFSAFVLVNSLQLSTMYITSKQVTTALHMPMIIPFSAIPIGMLIITVTQSIELVYYVVGLRRKSKEV